MKTLRKLVCIVLTLSFMVMPAYAAEEPKTFPDVPEGSWAYEYIMKLAEDGVITGYGDGTFRPKDDVSYDEFAALAVRACKGFDADKANERYSMETVEGSNWATVYHKYAVDNNFYAWDNAIGVWNESEMTADFSSVIDLTGPCTREAAAAIVSDVLVEDMGESLDVMWLTALEEEYAYPREKNVEFLAEESSTPSYRIRYAVANNIAHGILSGFPNGTFGGKQHLTREQAAAIIYRLLYSDHQPSDAAIGYGEYQKSIEEKRTEAIKKIPSVDLSRYDLSSKDGRLEASKAKVKEVIAKLAIDPDNRYWNDSESMKLAYICGWLGNNAETQHDQSLEAYSSNYGNEAYAALFSGSAACSGFCKALKLFCDELGYECVHVNKDLWTHQWCKVYVDGHWEIADVQGGVYGNGERHPVEGVPVKANATTVFFELNIDDNAFRCASGYTMIGLPMASYEALPQAAVKGDALKALIK